MGSFTDLSDFIARVSGGSSGNPEVLRSLKTGRVAGANGVCVVGRWSSLWEYEGQPGNGVPPTTMAYPTSAMAGCIPFVNASGGRQKLITSITAMASVSGTLLLYDRLAHIGGLDGNLGTAQSVAMTALPRYTNGVGVEAWVEIYTAVGVTARNIAIDYTNVASVSGRTGNATIGGTGLREVQRMFPIGLQSGDVGISQLNTVTVTTGTGTSGNFGITLLKPIASVPVGPAGVGQVVSFLTEGEFPVLESGACLAWTFCSSAIGGPSVDALLRTVER